MAREHDRAGGAHTGSALDFRGAAEQIAEALDREQPEAGSQRRDLPRRRRPVVRLEYPAEVVGGNANPRVPHADRELACWPADRARWTFPLGV